jgi:DNA-binding transcriptional MocR family regulator
MVIERGPQQTLVDSCVQWVRKRIGSRVLRPGMRVHSIRSFARQAVV